MTRPAARCYIVHMDARTDSGSKHLRRPPSRGQAVTRRRWRGEHGRVPSTPATSSEQHSLLQSIALHLLPGAALFACVLGAGAVGIEPVVALLFGIGLVIAPLELGYLFLQGKRRNGTWSLSGVINYDERFSARQIARWAAPLVLWWIVILAVSIAVLDSWLADTVFGWYPESIRNMATFDGGGDTPATWLLVILFATALALNGVIGPVAEELYFRGHLLPRIDRFGRAAPVLNTVLFSIYHFWSPWQNLARVIGLLPWVFVVWRKRSVQLSIAVHVTANTIFLLLLVPAFV
jgi:membrane protease YdiL (CAAX protease family)